VGSATWFENTYPGCRVDNSNHMYSYSFEPNHAWSAVLLAAAGLLKYFKGIADKYGLRKHLRFETLVETCGLGRGQGHSGGWTAEGQGRGPARWWRPMRWSRRSAS